MDDVGAEHRHRVGEERTGPERREVGDAQARRTAGPAPVDGGATRRRRGRGRARPTVRIGARAGPVPAPDSSAGQRRVEPERRRRLQEAAARVDVVEAARRRSGPSAGWWRRCRPRWPGCAGATASSTISAVVRAVVHARMSGFSSSERSDRFHATFERSVVGPLVVADHGAEVVPVLETVHDGEADVAVLRRHHVGHRRLGAPRPQARSTIVSIVIGLNSCVMITASRAERSMTPPTPVSIAPAQADHRGHGGEHARPCTRRADRRPSSAATPATPAAPGRPTAPAA